jgi:hypothetical protein
MMWDARRTVTSPGPTRSVRPNRRGFLAGTQRRVGSTVAVHDGETIALGGLITDGITLTKSGIPILQDVPVTRGDAGGGELADALAGRGVILCQLRVRRETGKERRVRVPRSEGAANHTDPESCVSPSATAATKR